MRRLGLALSAVVLCVAMAACNSSTAPNPRHGEWMPDGTWCSGYVNPTGRCVEEDGGP